MTRVGLTQRVRVIEEYGERRDCLDQQWTVLLDDLGYTPIPLPNRLDTEQVTEYLDSLALDAVVLTSGNDLATLDEPSNPAPERDEFETAVLEHAIETDLPVLGICRGLELLNVYFGGNLAPVTDHVATTHSLEFTDPETELPTTSNFELPEEVTVNSYHDWGIEPDGVAEDLVVLGTASDDTVEFVVHESAPIWGMMWHPERESPSATLDRQILTHTLGGAEQ